MDVGGARGRRGAGRCACRGSALQPGAEAVAGGGLPAVHALGVLLLLVRVAGAAVDPRQLLRVRKLLDVAVAGGAIEVGVGRGLQRGGVEVGCLARLSACPRAAPARGRRRNPRSSAARPPGRGGPAASARATAVSRGRPRDSPASARRIPRVLLRRRLAGLRLARGLRGALADPFELERMLLLHLALGQLPRQPGHVHRVGVGIEDDVVEVPDEDGECREPGLVEVDRRGRRRSRAWSGGR